MPDADKTQDATPHRRQQAREKGMVPHSQDLGSAVLLVAAMLVLLSLGGAVIEFFAKMIVAHVGGEPWLRVDRELVLTRWHAVRYDLAWSVLPVLGLMMLVGISINVAQVGFLFVPQRVAPDWSRLSPLKGLKRLFSLASVMRLSFGLFKVLVVGVVAVWSLYAERAQVVALTTLEVGPIAYYVANLVIWTSLKIGVALLVLAVLDYWYQRFKHEQDIRMTTQEVREEMKEQVGDPQVLARRRAVQRELALNRLGDAVPKADVVITNPTELAIAIQYVPDEMAAPIVVAKGAGHVAARIRKLALEHNIPIVEKKPLAQKLFRDVEVNHPVPSDVYAAVAEVLAYVYQLKGKSIPTAQL